ncbi:hypothetical protein [Mycolicibacterium gadium]|uniref:hypothetical protein n=1 Tax=Mycolicibacterium gadium TaxID=1794 RepID=UPI0027E03C04|nr:hypothetical protein [Mycolicibacterium gadium]
MVTIPAVVWRGGFALRALTTGGVVGLCVGALAWLDSGFWISGVIVLVVVGTFYGAWMARRMARYWPGAKDLTGKERVAVATAVRRGEPIEDARLSQPVIDYSSGLHDAAEKGRWLRWVLIWRLLRSRCSGCPGGRRGCSTTRIELWTKRAGRTLPIGHPRSRSCLC